MEHNGTKFVEYIKSNPLESIHKRIQCTLRGWLQAAAEKGGEAARAGQAPRSRRTSSKYHKAAYASDDEFASDDEADVVTVTKIQFLEQQLAELRALMTAMPARTEAPPSSQSDLAMQTAPSSQGAASSSSIQEALAALSAAMPRPAPAANAETVQTTPSSEPVTSRQAPAVCAAASIDRSATSEGSARSCDAAVITAVNASQPPRATNAPSEPVTPARPNMVSLVQQASAVKLKAAATYVHAVFPKVLLSHFTL